jgi:minor histocompatibility antigen H13
MAAEGPSAVPAPIGHLALLLVGLAPLFVTVDANFNIVITAALTVFVGCWRSVKPEPPADAMTKKVRDRRRGRASGCKARRRPPTVVAPQDAIRFPVVGSAVLFSLFLMFKFLPKDLVNLVLSGEGSRHPVLCAGRVCGGGGGGVGPAAGHLPDA